MREHARPRQVRYSRSVGPDRSHRRGLERRRAYPIEIVAVYVESRSGAGQTAYSTQAVLDRNIPKFEASVCAGGLTAGHRNGNFVAPEEWDGPRRIIEHGRRLADCAPPRTLDDGFEVGQMARDVLGVPRAGEP